MMGRSWRVRHGAGGGIGRARQDRGKRGVVPIDQARLRAEVRGEGEGLEGNTKWGPRLRGDDGAFPGLEEERHLRFAEAVDRLHRVADEEERAAVAFFPSGGEAAQQLVLRPGSVLVFVDQD